MITKIVIYVQEELTRIQNKVKTLLERKAKSADNLKITLEELQRDTEELENTLESLRLNEH